MLVTHLIIIGAKTTEEAAIHVLTILCLLQAIGASYRMKFQRLTKPLVLNQQVISRYFNIG